MQDFTPNLRTQSVQRIWRTAPNLTQNLDPGATLSLTIGPQTMWQPQDQPWNTVSAQACNSSCVHPKCWSPICISVPWPESRTKAKPTAKISAALNPWCPDPSQATPTPTPCSHRKQTQQVRVGLHRWPQAGHHGQLLQDAEELLHFGPIEPGPGRVQPVRQCQLQGHQVLEVDTQDGEAEAHTSCQPAPVVTIVASGCH